MMGFLQREIADSTLVRCKPVDSVRPNPPMIQCCRHFAGTIHNFMNLVLEEPAGIVRVHWRWLGCRPDRSVSKAPEWARTRMEQCDGSC